VYFSAVALVHTQQTYQPADTAFAQFHTVKHIILNHVFQNEFLFLPVNDFPEYNLEVCGVSRPGLGDHAVHFLQGRGN
jgi:hypothetical protein